LDVKEDKELQHWADLVSLDGNQTASSRGMVCIISSSFTSCAIYDSLVAAGGILISCHAQHQFVEFLLDILFHIVHRP
jgi:transcriptional regulator GlxA family with amidase domain